MARVGWLETENWGYGGKYGKRKREGKRKGADKKLNKQHLANNSDWELTFSSLLGLFEAPL